MLLVLLDVGGIAGSTQLCRAAMWSTSGPRGSKGSGSAGRTDRHMPRGRSLWKHCSWESPPCSRVLPRAGGLAARAKVVVARQCLQEALKAPFSRTQGCFQAYLSSRSRMLFSPAVTTSLHTGPLVMAGHGTIPSQQYPGVLMLNLSHQADQLLSCVASIFSCLPILSRAGATQCLLTVASLAHHKKMSSIPEG